MRRGGGGKERTNSFSVGSILGRIAETLGLCMSDAEEHIRVSRLCAEITRGWRGIGELRGFRSWGGWALGRAQSNLPFTRKL